MKRCRETLFISLTSESSCGSKGNCLCLPGKKGDKGHAWEMDRWIHTNVSVPHHCHSNMRHKFSVLVWITFHVTSHSLFSLLCERDNPISNSSVQNSKIYPMSLLASDPVQRTGSMYWIRWCWDPPFTPASYVTWALCFSLCLSWPHEPNIPIACMSYFLFTLCCGLTPAVSSAPHSCLLTLPWWNGGENWRSKSKKKPWVEINTV